MTSNSARRSSEFFGSNLLEAQPKVYPIESNILCLDDNGKLYLEIVEKWKGNPNITSFSLLNIRSISTVVSYIQDNKVDIILIDTSFAEMSMHEIADYLRSSVDYKIHMVFIISKIEMGFKNELKDCWWNTTILNRPYRPEKLAKLINQASHVSVADLCF